jgi:hypothetical protein
MTNVRTLNRIKAGDVVEVEFLDHVEDGGEPYLFLVWGVVAVNGRKHYEILSWAHAEKHVEAAPHNEKRFTIVKAAVTRITKLIPAP